MIKVVTLERLTKFYTDLKEKIKANYYSKLEVDGLISNVEVETSTLLDKNTYASEDNTGSVKLADKAKQIEGIEYASEFSYYGRNKNGEKGFFPFPIGENEELSNFQSVKLNVKTGDTISIELLNINPDNNLLVQGYEFIEGPENIVSTLKTFNNAEKDNFIYNEENIDFENGMHIKNMYGISSSENTLNGFYESEVINKDNYLEILGIEVN